MGVVLVAHGSRDPRAAASTSALAEGLAEAHPEWEVHASYLDHAGPRPLEVLRWLARSARPTAGPKTAGYPRAILVPLLLTAAYHGKVDVPAVLDEARDLPIDVRLADVLGPVSDLLVDALIRRLPTVDLDAVVLSAAGTRDPAARATVAQAAAALGARLGLPCTVAYASAAPPMPGEAVRSFGAAGVGMASYFLAPGLLYDKAVDSALAAGAVAVAPPLGDAPEVISLIARRVSAALPARLQAA